MQRLEFQDLDKLPLATVKSMVTLLGGTLVYDYRYGHNQYYVSCTPNHTMTPVVPTRGGPTEQIACRNWLDWKLNRSGDQ